VRGEVDSPVLAGGADLRIAALEVNALEVRIVQIQRLARLEGDRVVLDSLVAWSRGEIRASGEIVQSSLGNPIFDLSVTAVDARVIDTDDVRFDLDAEIEVDGSWEALRVVGEVRTRRGVLQIPEVAELGGGRVVNLDDPGTFARIDTVLAVQRDRLLARAPILRNLELDLTVEVDRDVWLRSTEANIEIYTPFEVGPLRVRMNGGPAALAVSGTVNTERGEYEFLSRRFLLTRGAVTMLGERGFDPFFQIAAEHEVRLPGREAFSIRVILDGTLDDLAVALESTAQPPIPQSDRLSYLAFDREASSPLQQQGSGLATGGAASGELVGTVAGLATQQLTAVAVDALVSDLERDAARELNLDVMRITPADLPAEVFTGSYRDVLLGTEIEAGRYVSPRLFVAVQARPTFRYPGLRVEYATPRGFQWVTSGQPRFLPTEPTLRVREVERTNVFGSFLFREWRF